jgi:pilus assembly protein CpaC
MSVTRNLTLLSLVAALNCGAAYAQQDQLGGAPAERLTMSDPTASDLSQQLTLTVNKSYMLESNTDIGDIIVANPAIANVVARSGRRVAVMGMAPGESNIVFLDRTGRQIKVLEVSVTDGISGMDQLRGLIKRHVPEA